MLDEIFVVSRGGKVLFKHLVRTYDDEKSHGIEEPSVDHRSSVNELITKVLIEESAGRDHKLVIPSKELINLYISMQDSTRAIKYIIDNQNGWIIAGISPKLSLSQSSNYVDEVLLRVQKSMSLMTLDELDNDLANLHSEVERLVIRGETKKGAESPVAMRKFQETEKFQYVSDIAKKKIKEAREPEFQSDSDQNQHQNPPVSPNLNIRSAKQSPFNKKDIKTPPSSTSSGTKKKDTKKPMKWNQDISAEDALTLDYSESPSTVTSPTEKITTSQGFQDHTDEYDLDEIDRSMTADIENRSDDDDTRSPDKHETSRWLGFLKSLTATKIITEDVIVPILAKMQELLISKNVASSTAERLCDSVKVSLIGREMKSMRAASKLVKEALEISLQKVLTPKHSVDILRDIHAAKDQGRPYVIVFCGVNGVGKSTNLAKVCFWLLQNRLRVLIAACDTFRSGAVEQLKVHVRNLQSLNVSNDSTAVQVDLYEKGYGKDAAGIAKDAITFAKSQKFDIVLIDTAGRMQDNEPLMRALAKLVRVNRPDKVLFVGEALVGNEAVDQLVKFNQALKDFSDTNNPRQIDGILLTKFDTIDDKVGAAISMAYATGQPILFVGTGQTYTDLRKLNIATVLDALLKS